jgi:hypothetical protein
VGNHWGLVEIPVELYLEKDVQSVGMQVDLFESVKNSESEHIRVENNIIGKGYTPIIREILVEIETYDIPVEVYLEKDEKGISRLEGGMQQ